MAIQFRRRKRLFPGVTLNAGNKGLGVRLGVKGAGISFSPTGTRVSGSVPGTGLSTVKKVSNKGSPVGWGVWIAIGAVLLIVVVVVAAAVVPRP